MKLSSTSACTLVSSRLILRYDGACMIAAPPIRVVHRTLPRGSKQHTVHRWASSSSLTDLHPFRERKELQSDAISRQDLCRVRALSCMGRSVKPDSDSARQTSFRTAIWDLADMLLTCGH